MKERQEECAYTIMNAHRAGLNIRGKLDLTIDRGEDPEVVPLDAVVGDDRRTTAAAGDADEGRGRLVRRTIEFTVRVIFIAVALVVVEAENGAALNQTRRFEKFITRAR